MDPPPPSVITQVSRDDEEDAACGDEGEFAEVFRNFSVAHDKVTQRSVCVCVCVCVRACVQGATVSENVTCGLL